VCTSPFRRPSRPLQQVGDSGALTTASFGTTSWMLLTISRLVDGTAHDKRRRVTLASTSRRISAVLLVHTQQPPSPLPKPKPPTPSTTWSKNFPATRVAFFSLHRDRSLTSTCGACRFPRWLSKLTEWQPVPEESSRHFHSSSNNNNTSSCSCSSCSSNNNNNSNNSWRCRSQLLPNSSAGLLPPCPGETRRSRWSVAMWPPATREDVGGRWCFGFCVCGLCFCVTRGLAGAGHVRTSSGVFCSVCFVTEVFKYFFEAAVDRCAPAEIFLQLFLITHLYQSCTVCMYWVFTRQHALYSASLCWLVVLFSELLP